MLILVFSLLYLAVFWVQINVLSGFDLFPSASILFLPAGIKLMCMLSGHWHGLLGLYIGKLAVEVWILGSPWTLQMCLIEPLLWIVPAYVTLMWVMRRLGVEPDLSNVTTYHVLVIAFSASLVTSLFVQSYLVWVGEVHREWLKAVWSMTVGDTSGIVLTLVLVAWFRRRISSRYSATT